MPSQSLLPGIQQESASSEHLLNRAVYRECLRQYLQDPAFRATEGFPIGDDEAILALSDPPFYTACPNPFLPEIIVGWQQERAELREALELPDDSHDNGNGGPVVYQREPFAADVSEGKNDPIYNAHSYHTKVPHKAIMRYILHYTDPGDVVFDGFCGTGMTGVAAQLCHNRQAVESLGYRVDAGGVIYEGDKAISRLGARKAVLVDLSPAATFIAYNYNTPVDVAAFEREAKRVLQEVEAECGWMYETWHPRCDDRKRAKGRINFTVWSDIFICPNCTGEMVFWNVAVDRVSGQVHNEFRCPHCSVEQSKRNLGRAQEAVYNPVLGQVINRAKQTPVLINYSVAGRNYEKNPDDNDQELVRTVEGSDIPHWYPLMRIDRDIDLGYERDYRPLGIYSVDAFFTKRSLWILAALWSKAKEISDSRLSRALMFSITGMQVNLSRMNRWRANVSFPYNPLSGTLYVSSLQSEANVHTGITNKIKRLVSIWSSANVNLRNDPVITTQSSAATLYGLESNSIDYIFTDPPFGSNIIYSDLSILWESWLSISTRTTSEAVVHRRKKIAPTTLDDYRQLMTLFFAEAHRVLRAGRWMTVEFHNTSNAVWNAIQEAILRAGFMIADVRTLDKRLGSFKQVTTTAAVKQDLIISAYKPREAFERRFIEEAGTLEGAWDFVRQHLAQLPVIVEKGGVIETVVERLPYLLFDRMVAFHIQRGAAVPLSAAEFYAGLRERFAERDGMIFLADQVPQYDAARLRGGPVEQLTLFVVDEKSAIQWLRQQLDPSTGGQPQTRQNLLTEFLRHLHQARHEALPDLGEILKQNFLQDDTERWYVPDPNRASDLEKIRQRDLLREFARYAEERGRLRQFRTEAVRAGFADAWRRRDFATIVKVAERLPEAVLQEDQELLMYYDNASLRAG